MSLYTDLNQSSPHSTKAVLEDAEAIYQTVFNVLATRKGQRLFRPLFGTNIHKSLHKLITDGTRLELFREVVEAVRVNEPRVDLNTADTDIGPDENNIGRYPVDLSFDIRGLASPTQRNFRFQGTLTGAEGL